MSSYPATTRLLFVRHGQTIWNAEQRYAGSSEVALSAESGAQIEALTLYLNNIAVDAIYSSPLSRCLTTITPTAQAHHLRIIAREDLKERNLGAWEGHTGSEIHPKHSGYHYPISAYNGEFRIPGAETLDELEQRARLFLHEMHADHPGQTVLVATHAGIIWITHARIVQNKPVEVHWPTNCSITTIVNSENHFLTAGTQELSELTMIATR